MAANVTVDSIEPPRTSVGVLGWLKRNLFSTWYNSLLTIIAAWILYVVLSQLIVWMFTSAHWSVVTANWRLFMIGPYPPDQARRVHIIVAMVAGLFGVSAGVWGGTIRTFGIWLAAALATFAVLPIQTFDGEGRIWLVGDLALVIAGYFLGRTRKGLGRYLLILWLLSFVATIILLGGIEGNSLLPDVSTGRWGGLLLTFMLAIVSIVLSFPLGVLLALGRRSALPAVKWFSIAYIEIVRGVPLVTVLYMTQIMLPLFLPGEFRVDNVVRAMAAFTLFTAAYMAENVRGGLQAIPSGQIEAAHALGLNSPLTTLFIVLPQALRLVIPATVGLFISLFKDTTLATIVALLELLGVGRSVLAQPEFLGLQTEVYLFIAAVFFVFSYVMSYASYQLERALGVGKR
ncbi:MAG: amino acid ABC transporter permease [Chloroflexi bacterium]|nr:amino acid ABC transporter permease [Chloroflexota bacterium]